jgi:YD repeat-containing protein
MNEERWQKIEQLYHAFGTPYCTSDRNRSTSPCRSLSPQSTVLHSRKAALVEDKHREKVERTPKKLDYHRVGGNSRGNETTPQGSISYTYDAAGRRTSMTVVGQPIVNYTYDNANRLIQITQGSSSASMGYDTSNRRTSLTLPNGIVVTYAYDAASRLTGLSYNLGTASLGNIVYSYDAAGRRTSVGGSLARTSLPVRC